MDQNEFLLAVWKWATRVLNPTFDLSSVNEASEILVIRADTDGPRPDKPYLTYNVIGMSEPGLPYYGELDDDGNQDICIDRLPTVSFQGYMTAAEGYLYTLKESIYLQETKDHLRELGLSIINVLDVIDISTLLDETRERRWSMDVECNYGRVLVDTSAGKIDNIDWSGTFEPPQ